MNKLVTVTSNNSVAPYDADVDLDALRESVSGLALFPGEWIKFRKGIWLVGQEEKAASLTEPYVAHMGEILIGWIKIVDNVVIKRIAGRIADKFRPPMREQLDDGELIDTPHDPWKPMTAMVMRDASGEIFTYTSLSASGRTAVNKTIDQYLRKCHAFPGKMPAVLLGVGTAYSKKHNSEYAVPVFRIVSWEPWNTEAVAAKPATEDNAAWEDTPPAKTPTETKESIEAKASTEQDLDDMIPF
jgi:hypothetical protein